MAATVQGIVDRDDRAGRYDLDTGYEVVSNIFRFLEVLNAWQWLRLVMVTGEAGGSGCDSKLTLSIRAAWQF